MATDAPGERIPADAAALLGELLKGDDPVHRALRAQIPHLRVTGGCACPCASLDFGLDRAAVSRAPAPRRNPVAEATVLDAGGEPVGGALVFADGGYVSRLEVYTWGDEELTRLPSPDRLG